MGTYEFKGVTKAQTIKAVFVKAEYEFPFADVAEDAWYYNDVLNAHKLGLIDGLTPTEYKPAGNLTIAEAIKLAVCMHQLYHDGKVTLENGTVNWYDTYVEYALENKVITSIYDNYDEYATREEFARIFYHALPSTELNAINSVDDNAIPDIKMSDPYASEIYALYRAGVVVGNDDMGTYRPKDNIMRSEVAAVLSRMMDSTSRKHITLP